MTDTTLEESAPFFVGQTLKAARLERGLTIEQVSKSLYIPKRLLAQLEEDDTSLVCDVYTLGFVKLYAQYLELNEQDLVEKFKEQNLDHSKSSQLIFPAPLPGRGMPSFRILALSLLALAAIIIGWKWVSKYNFSPAPFPEIVIDPAPSSIEQTNLPEPPIEEEMAPIEDAPSDLESMDLILKTGRLEGEYPLFGERVYQTSEESLEQE